MDDLAYVVGWYANEYRLAFKTACGSNETQDEIDGLLDEYHDVLDQVVAEHV